MKRDVEIAPTVQLLSTVGLMPPSRRRQRHLFDLTVDGLRRPPYVRWSWSTVNGDLLIGTVHRHAHQMPRDDPSRPFKSWVRGFVFYKERQVAVRPYWWPLSAYEEFDRVTNHLVMEAVTALLRPAVPKSYRFRLGVDNDYLLTRFGHYATSW